MLPSLPVSPVKTGERPASSAGAHHGQLRPTVTPCSLLLHVLAGREGLTGPLIGRIYRPGLDEPTLSLTASLTEVRSLHRLLVPHFARHPRSSRSRALLSEVPLSLPFLSRACVSGVCWPRLWQRPGRESGNVTSVVWQTRLSSLSPLSWQRAAPDQGFPALRSQARSLALPLAPTRPFVPA